MTARAPKAMPFEPEEGEGVLVRVLVDSEDTLRRLAQAFPENRIVFHAGDTMFDGVPVVVAQDLAAGTVVMEKQEISMEVAA